MTFYRGILLAIFHSSLLSSNSICHCVTLKEPSMKEEPDFALAVDKMSNGSEVGNKSKPNNKLDLIAVVQLSKFRPTMQDADEIIERIFSMSLNADKSFANDSESLSLASNSTRKRNNASRISSSSLTARGKKVLGDLQPILDSKRFQASKNKKKYLQKRCNFSWEFINEVADGTIDQFDDPRYMVLRKYRLTASTFGNILKAIRRDSYPPSLFKRLLGEYNLQKVSSRKEIDWRIKAVRWGKFHESSVLDTLRQMHPTWNIKRAGLYLHESGLLGASPDAITDECVIEIKCPYRFRRDENLEESFLPENKYIIVRGSDGTYHVNPNHIYYDQVQGEILFSGRQYGLLYIWTPNEAISFKIEKDESWVKNVDLLLDFYMNEFIPHVLHLKNRHVITEENKIDWRAF